eukprot:4203130-Pleurochrysis_carterae.AAC.1
MLNTELSSYAKYGGLAAGFGHVGRSFDADLRRFVEGNLVALEGRLLSSRKHDVEPQKPGGSGCPDTSGST